MESFTNPVGGTFYGELADVARNISKEEWNYYNTVDWYSDELASILENNKISHDDFAYIMGISKRSVKNILAGDAHGMTVRNLANMFFRLGYKMTISVEKLPELKE